MPLTYDQALLAAKAFLSKEPFPHPDYRLVLAEGESITEGWYFDYQIERVDGEPLQFPRDSFGGAPGFKVFADDGQVRVVDWQERLGVMARTRPASGETNSGSES